VRERLEEFSLQLAQAFGIVGTSARGHPRNTNGTGALAQLPNVAKYGIAAHTGFVPADLNPLGASVPQGDSHDSAKLAALLEEARAASPQDRIAWRDPIASYDELAIAGVTPWLADSALAAFAIRVIRSAGERAAPDEACRVLRAARPRLPAALQGDVDWAIAALKAVQKRDAAPKPAATSDTKAAAAPAAKRAPAARSKPSSAA